MPAAMRLKRLLGEVMADPNPLSKWPRLKGTASSHGPRENDALVGINRPETK